MRIGGPTARTHPSPVRSKACRWQAEAEGWVAGPKGNEGLKARRHQFVVRPSFCNRAGLSALPWELSHYPALHPPWRCAPRMAWAGLGWIRAVGPFDDRPCGMPLIVLVSSNLLQLSTIFHEDPKNLCGFVSWCLCARKTLLHHKLKRREALAAALALLRLEDHAA
jgi:hypothetical protein